MGVGQAVVRQTFSRLRLTTPFVGFNGGTLGSPRGGTNSDRVQWTKQGAVSGAALRFLQAGTAPRRKKRLSARGAGERSETERAKNEAPDAKKPPSFGGGPCYLLAVMVSFSRVLSINGKRYAPLVHFIWMGALLWLPSHSLEGGLANGYILRFDSNRHSNHRPD